MNGIWKIKRNRLMEAFWQEEEDYGKERDGKRGRVLTPAE